MSIQEQRRLVESIHPFGLLSSFSMDALMKKIDIAYYPKDTLLISKKIPTIAFYIIIKGSVKEVVDGEMVTVFGSGDSFDADSIIYENPNGDFIVEEDLICYEIKKDDFLDLLQDQKVKSYFLKDFVSRHQQLKNFATQSQLTPFIISKVSDIFLHKPCIVDANESIYEALKLQQELKSNAIIVKDGDEYGIVTDTNLRQKVLLEGVDIKSPIKNIATPKIISIDINDFLFNALILMTHSEIKRLVVKDNDKIVGLLEQLDLLSFFTSHSHLISLKIDRASSIDDLKEVGDEFRSLIVLLRTKGVKVRYITKLISSLNDKIYKKLFDMCVDESLRDKCTLMVMGSEGREEQTLKSDQDNALIIDDGIDESLFIKPMLELNKMLLELGYEKCSGNIMVSNEFYRRTLGSYKKLISSFSYDLSEQNLQYLAIFLDAKFVAGNRDIFDDFREYLMSSFSLRDDLFAHLAKASLAFETPLSMFLGFVLDKQKDMLDIKKGGIFALVHSIRVLSLEHKIKQTNTIERIKELNNLGVIDKAFATELIESFDTLSSIRLSAMLEAKNSSEANFVDPNKLDKIQRDLLKDSFKIVNKLKKFISFHFHLNMVV